MSAVDGVVAAFYEICDASEGVAESDVPLWLGALALLLAEEIADPARVARLAQEAAASLDAPALPTTAGTAAPANDRERRTDDA